MTSYVHVHNSFTHHSLSLETTQPFTSRIKGKVNALCKPLDYSPSGSSVHGYIQARQEYRSGLTFLPPGDLSSSEVQPMPTGSPVLAGGFFFFFFFLPLYLFFYWRMIALQNFVVFCQTSIRISCRYTHVPSLSSPSSSHLLDCHRAPVWVPWVIQQIPISYLLYLRYFKFPCYSPHSLPPPLPTVSIGLFSIPVSLVLPCK